MWHLETENESEEGSESGKNGCIQKGWRSVSHWVESGKNCEGEAQTHISRGKDGGTELGWQRPQASGCLLRLKPWGTANPNCPGAKEFSCEQGASNMEGGVQETSPCLHLHLVGIRLPEQAETAGLSVPASWAPVLCGAPHSSRGRGRFSHHTQFSENLPSYFHLSLQFMKQKDISFYLHVHR